MLDCFRHLFDVLLARNQAKRKKDEQKEPEEKPDPESVDVKGERIDSEMKEISLEVRVTDDQATLVENKI